MVSFIIPGKATTAKNRVNSLPLTASFGEGRRTHLRFLLRILFDNTGLEGDFMGRGEQKKLNSNCRADLQLALICRRLSERRGAPGFVL